MKGYKGFDKNLRCRNFQFEAGKKYRHDGKPRVCESGFHFCANLKDVHSYYRLKDSRICEVEALGSVVSKDGKSATDHIKILRELSRGEVLSLTNTGNENTGVLNSGDRNSGFFCSCDNSSGLFMSKRISFEAFNKPLAEGEYSELIESYGYAVCQEFWLIKYRVRAKTGKFGDYRYMSYKGAWRVFWNGLTFRERNAVWRMPHLDKAVFEEITGVKL